MTKRQREQEGVALDVIVLDKASGPSVPPITTSLASLVYPLTNEAFLKEKYTQKAFAVKAHSTQREKRLAIVKNMLFGFNPVKMLENSASDGIHVWLKTKSGELKSMQTDATSAFNCYNAGHSLYFRASEHNENEFLRSVGKDMGYGDVFGCYHDGKNRAEIETFVSNIGHTTPWHFDYMENFTIQLRGAKKWSLMKTDVPQPYRSCATHFPEHKQVLHDQMKIHKYDHNDFSGVPADAETRCETVTLYAGDVLYHPAGWWHKCEAVDNLDNASSLSINLSFMPLSWMQLMIEGLQHTMTRSALFREAIVARSSAEGRQQAASRLKLLVQLVNELQPADLFPKNLGYSDNSHGVINYVVFDKKGGLIEVDGASSADEKVFATPADSKYRRSPLAVLFRTEDFYTNKIQKTPKRKLSNSHHDHQHGSACDHDDEEEEDEDESEEEEETEFDMPDDHFRYDVHCNFGNEDITSRATLALIVPSNADVTIASLNSLAIVAPSATVSEKVLATVPRNVLDVLVYAGYLTTVE